MILLDALKRANGRRIHRTLSLSDVSRVVKQVAMGAEFASAHGGIITSSRDTDSRTTVVVAAMVDGEGYWEIVSCPANPTVRHPWPCVHPRGVYPPENTDEKIRFWAKMAMRINKHEYV